jgi:outer membrane protein TolC
MKQLFLTTFCVILSVSIAIGETLTIEICRERAKANFPLIQQYALIEQTAGYNISNANKSYLPQFSLVGKATYQSEVTSLPQGMIDMLANLPKPVNFTTMSKDQYQVALEINQTLWDGGNVSAQKKALLATEALEKQQVEVNLYSLNERVDQLFFGILLLEEQIKQNKILQTELQTSFSRLEAYKNNGIANQSDVDVIKVEQLNAIQKETELKNTQLAYRVMLAAFTRSVIDDRTVLLKPIVELNQVVDLSNKRPELKQFSLQNQLFETQKSMIYATNLPKIGLFLQGGYGRPAFNMFDNSFNPFYIGGLRLSWNFSGLYSQNANLKKLELNQKMVDVQRETFLFNTDLKTRQQRLEITKLESVISKDDDIIRLRESIKQSAQAKLENGTLAVSDLIREINAENQAKQVKALHEIQLLVAVYQLKYNINNQ